ncbi:hypothetical protein LSTR_LSTR009507 [Laodelphax striatellus]|uniref:Coatomer subunit delta n=2 Tax=Delphacidae TaxID=33362 RepID=A0A482WEM1_LAOST|nr:hypothetical protein LSTR_LSTR009507 [Laodelphax striatellus]
MVLIAAAVCTKAGKTIVSRQFVEMTKARIEGLLAAFPKLMSTGKQHTFVETESVRYVYQPLEKLYMLLITTKASNILEDLETLRLFSRVIQEYCRSMDEAEIADNAFNLIFAFDEIVALGYRESVNLAQIRTFVEMDSHEEKVYQAVRQTQEREAMNQMRKRAKELQRARMEADKKGYKGSSLGGQGGFDHTGGFGSSSTFSSPTVIGETPEPKSIYSNISKPAASTKAMKLGSKSRDVESFVDQLKSEGENVVTPAANKPSSVISKIPVQSLANIDDVHIRQEEKLMLRVGRDGGVQTFELHGLITLRISDEKWGKIKVVLDNKDTRGIQLQTHPNVDKELFKAKSQIGLKNPTKPFPLSTDVGVLKWRFQSQDDSCVPFSINCWPSENGQGGCDVNIEYELEHNRLELNDVAINIPLPIGCSPVVTECDGDYTHESRKNMLTWNLALIDSTNRTGALEFSAATAIPSDFFPLNISFVCKKPYADLRVTDVILVEDDTPVKYSSETIFYTDKYEIC